MESKPPAAVVVRISKGERHDLDAAAPFSTTTSSLQGGVGGSAFTPKLIELVFGPGSTRLAEKLSPCIACTALAAPSVRSRVFLSTFPLPPCQDVAAERPALGFLQADHSFSNSRSFLAFVRSACRKFGPSLQTLFDGGPPVFHVFTRGESGHCPRGHPRSPSVAC